MKAYIEYLPNLSFMQTCLPISNKQNSNSWIPAYAGMLGKSNIPVKTGIQPFAVLQIPILVWKLTLDSCFAGMLRNIFYTDETTDRSV